MLQRWKRLGAVGLFLTLLVGVSLWAGAETWAAPLLMPFNDTFATATDASGGASFTDNNVDLPTASMALETGETQCGFNDTASVWYKFTPTVNGQLTASVVPLGDDDVTIGLFTAIGTSVTCTDDGTFGGETENLPAQALTANTTYYVRVGVDPTFNNPLEQANVTINFTGPPEVSIADPTNLANTSISLPNNSTIPLTMTVGSTPIAYQVTIRNDGFSNLTLGALNLTGSGFTISQDLRGNMLASGTFTTFTIQFSAPTAGVINGNVQFATNDADENPTILNFKLTAQAVPATPTGTLNVATTGTDSGNCQTTPCKTLPYALGQAVHGNLIMIATGTYTNGGTPFLPGPANNINKTVTLQGAGASSTILQGNGSSPVIKIQPGVNVQMSNVTLSNGVTGLDNDGVVTLDNVIITNNNSGTH